MAEFLKILIFVTLASLAPACQLIATPVTSLSVALIANDQSGHLKNAGYSLMVIENNTHPASERTLVNVSGEGLEKAVNSEEPAEEAVRGNFIAAQNIEVRAGERLNLRLELSLNFADESQIKCLRKIGFTPVFQRTYEIAVVFYPAEYRGGYYCALSLIPPLPVEIETIPN